MQSMESLPGWNDTARLSFYGARKLLSEIKYICNVVYKTIVTHNVPRGVKLVTRILANIGSIISLSVFCRLIE